MTRAGKVEEDDARARVFCWRSKAANNFLLIARLL
jgi:hypothetical protein